MKKLLNITNDIDENQKVEDNLYVKNIIVKKDKANKSVMTYVATEKWISQLGNRLLT